MNRHTPRLVLALAALAAAACGSSNGGTGKMSVHLVDAPGDYLGIDLDVQRVEIRTGSDGPWRTLGTPDRVVNLLSLTDGVAETLVDGASLPAGSYGQLRLVLGPRNSVLATDGRHALKVPSGMQSGVKLNVSFEVQDGTTKDVFVDFDAHRSIFVHQAGNSGQYLLRPVVRAFDRVVTGSIQGALTDATTQAGIAGATVMAETVEGGTPAVVRSVTTRADGSYTLDLLPVGASYHVVSQPVTGTAAYAAQASPAIALSAAAPIQPWSAAFAPVATGNAAGRVLPAATEADADLVVATQPIAAGGATPTLVVRTAPAAVLAGLEGWALDALPPGSYALAVHRRTVDAAGEETVRTGTPEIVTVASGATTTVDLTVP